MKAKFLTTIAFLIIIVTSLISCNTTIKTVASWTNKDKIYGKQYNSIFIVVLTDNQQAKTILENDLAAAARAQGFKVFTSMESFGPITGKEGLPVKEAFLKKVSEVGCETIFTVSLIDQKSETRYVPGSSYLYAPYPQYGYYGMFGGYYNHATTYFSSPGYYSTDKTYFLECNLYNAKTEDLLVSIQSKADNPPAIEKSSKLYTESLIKELKSLGLLRI